MLCSASSCSSRAQRPRSRSADSMLLRIRSSATDWAVATAIAALVAKEVSACSSPSVKPVVAAQGVEGDKHPERVAAEDHRHQQRRHPGALAARPRARRSGPTLGRRFGRSAREHLPGGRALDRDAQLARRGRAPRPPPPRAGRRRPRAGSAASERRSAPGPASRSSPGSGRGWSRRRARGRSPSSPRGRGRPARAVALLLDAACRGGRCRPRSPVHSARITADCSSASSKSPPSFSVR